MLSEAERTDARRYLGFPVHGASVSGNQGWQFYQSNGLAEYRLGNLSDVEEAVVRQYLGTLVVLERAIPEVGTCLDTGSAAGWVRNRDELVERGRLFDDWRRRFCGFLGCRRGPGCSSRAPASRWWFDMDECLLNDRLSRGMGAAARFLGVEHDLFRPRGNGSPVRSEFRLLRLPVALDGGHPGYRRPRGYDRALRGTFDTYATQVGDYLVGPRGILFIAAMPPRLRPLCVLTNAAVDVLRPAGPDLPGLNGYGGVREPRLRTVLAGWPAEMTNGGEPGHGRLPDNEGGARWSVLLPPTPAPLMGGDLLRDADGTRFVVRVAELSEFGWRLSARRAGI